VLGRRFGIESRACIVTTPVHLTAVLDGSVSFWPTPLSPRDLDVLHPRKTTLATNASIERLGAKTSFLIATDCFRYVLDIEHREPFLRII